MTRRLHDESSNIAIRLYTFQRLKHQVDSFYLYERPKAFSPLISAEIEALIFKGEGELPVKQDKLMKDFEARKEEFYKELLEKEEKELKKIREKNKDAKKKEEDQ